MVTNFQPAKPSIERRIALAEQIARAHLSAPFGVQEFAEAAGLSRSRFSVAYQEHRGLSAGHFLRRARMEMAIELLRAGAHAISEVGKMVGYPEPTGFGRAFRRHTGLSPSRFKSSMKKGSASAAVSEIVPTSRAAEVIALTPLLASLASDQSRAVGK